MVYFSKINLFFKIDIITTNTSFLGDRLLNHFAIGLDLNLNHNHEKIKHLKRALGVITILLLFFSSCQKGLSTESDGESKKFYAIKN